MTQIIRENQDHRVALGIEFTSRRGEIALAVSDSSGTQIHVEQVMKKFRHHDDVVPAIDRLCVRQGLVARDIDEVDVSIGPGGFTGVRVAVTTAKMLGYATGARIVPVPTERVVAEGVEVIPGAQLLVAIAGKRATSWCALFMPDGESSSWTLEQSGRMVPLADFVLDLEPDRDLIIAYDVIDEAAQSVCARAGVQLVEATFRAANCLHAAERMALSYGNVAALSVDPIDLVPEYGRDPEAVRLWHERDKPLD